MRSICAICLTMLIQTLISIPAIASDSSSSPWQGEWSWDGGADQTGNEWGGSLSIKSCDQTGCAYNIVTGSTHSVCQSEGRFKLSTPSKAVHEREGENFEGKKAICRIIFERKDAALLIIDSDGEGCSYFCGASGSFGGDFRRWSSVPMYRPSFDRRKAKQHIEKVICAHKVLSDLDRELSSKYNKLQAILTPETKQLRAEQAQWLKNRNQTCGTATDPAGCLEVAYKQRTAELKKEIGDACKVRNDDKKCKGNTD